MAKVKTSPKVVAKKATSVSPARKSASSAIKKPATTSPSAGKPLELLEASTKALRNIAALDASPSALAPNFAAELGAIDFRKMIGGPLQAAVDAQVASSLATVEFINQVGFITDTNGNKSLVMVDFSHDKTDFDEQGNPRTTTNKIKVPLIAMVQVPSLRIEHVIIDFNVKLNSVETANTSTSLGVDASVQGGWGPVKFKVSASFKRTSTSGIKIEREYALNVNVKAVQDEIAPGLDRILNLLAS